MIYTDECMHSFYVMRKSELLINSRIAAILITTFHVPSIITPHNIFYHLSPSYEYDFRKAPSHYVNLVFEVKLRHIFHRAYTNSFSSN